MPSSGSSGEEREEYNAAVAERQSEHDTIAMANMGKHYDVIDILLEHFGDKETKAGSGQVMSTHTITPSQLYLSRTQALSDSKKSKGNRGKGAKPSKDATGGSEAKENISTLIKQLLDARAASPARSGSSRSHDDPDDAKFVAAAREFVNNFDNIDEEPASDVSSHEAEETYNALISQCVEAWLKGIGIKRVKRRELLRILIEEDLSTPTVLYNFIGHSNIKALKEELKISNGTATTLFTAARHLNISPQIDLSVSHTTN